LATTIERDFTSQTTKSYKVTAIDNGGSSDVTISSSPHTYRWYFKVKTGASTTESISSNQDAQTLFDAITSPYDSLTAQGDFTVTANAAMDNNSNYTWIIYPNAWGTPNQILLDGQFNILNGNDLNDPTTLVTYDITNDYGVTTTYRFYRSKFKGAFDVNQTIKVDF